MGIFDNATAEMAKELFIKNGKSINRDISDEELLKNIKEQCSMKLSLVELSENKLNEKQMTAAIQKLYKGYAPDKEKLERNRENMNAVREAAFEYGVKRVSTYEKLVYRYPDAKAPNARVKNSWFAYADKFCPEQIKPIYDKLETAFRKLDMNEVSPEEKQFKEDFIQCRKIAESVKKIADMKAKNRNPKAIAVEEDKYAKLCDVKETDSELMKQVKSMSADKVADYVADLEKNSNLPEMQIRNLIEEGLEIIQKHAIENICKGDSETQPDFADRVFSRGFSSEGILESLRDPEIILSVAEWEPVFKSNWFKAEYSERERNRLERLADKAMAANYMVSVLSNCYASPLSSIADIDSFSCGGVMNENDFPSEVKEYQAQQDYMTHSKVAAWQYEQYMKGVMGSPNITFCSADGTAYTCPIAEEVSGKFFSDLRAEHKLIFVFDNEDPTKAALPVMIDSKGGLVKGDKVYDMVEKATPPQRDTSIKKPGFFGRLFGTQAYREWKKAEDSYQSELKSYNKLMEIKKGLTASAIESARSAAEEANAKKSGVSTEEYKSANRAKADSLRAERRKANEARSQENSKLFDELDAEVEAERGARDITAAKAEKARESIATVLSSGDEAKLAEFNAPGDTRIAAVLANTMLQAERRAGGTALSDILYKEGYDTLVSTIDNLENVQSFKKDVTMQKMQKFLDDRGLDMSKKLFSAAVQPRGAGGKVNVLESLKDNKQEKTIA